MEHQKSQQHVEQRVVHQKSQQRVELHAVHRINQRKKSQWHVELHVELLNSKKQKNDKNFAIVTK